jgi:integrase
MQTITPEHTKIEFRELDTGGKWSDAFALWLESKSPNTRRAYEKAWEELMDFTGKMPWMMSSADIETFVSHMRQEYSKSTIQQRLAAVSSFFSYAGQNYLDFVDGREVPLHHYNPAKAVRRPKVNAYGKAHPLNLDEVRAFLAAIDRETVQGKRDYALMLAYIATGRRNTEICNLTWGQIEQSDHRIWYRWEGKACTSGRYELPATVFHAICDFLTSTSRLQDIHPDDYIFTALSNHADRLPGAHHDPSRPLSGRYVRDLVKKYARLAGLDPERVRVHDLRHTAAMLRLEAGDSIDDISSFLGHSSLRTTSIYLHRVGGRRDNSWGLVQDMLRI